MSKSDTDFYSLSGASHIKGTEKWRAYIKNQHIGVFESKFKAIMARLNIEDIFTNILSKHDIESFYFRRNKTITIEVVLENGLTIYIPTGIECKKGRDKSEGKSNG